VTRGAPPRRAFTAFLLALVAACSKVPVPSSASRVADPEEAWARVLATYVDKLGRVNFAALATHRSDLDRYVAYIAVTPPDSIADPTRRLAYLINAYNALSMYVVLESGIPQRLDFFGRVQFFRLKHVVVGGKAISLYDLEKEKIRSIGDERVHFALNCMSVSCPRLPQVPFEGKILDHQLDAAARAFFAEPRNLMIDRTRHEIWLSEILSFYKEDFLRRAPSLVDYVDRWRSDKLPDNYEIRFFAYDWTINRQP
jgi:Protein of unknown function, DUF547